MLAMMSVIVDYTFKNVSNFLYSTGGGPLNDAGPGVTYSPTLPLDGPGCVNNTLISALKN